MERLINALSRKALIIGSCIILLFAVSCRNTEYDGLYFSFPPGSKPHENDWKYTGVITVTSNQSPITAKSKKKVNIKIYDKSKTIYLDEDFEFDSASIDANVVWEKFEELRVELAEVGNDFAEDPYNKQLVKSGPNKLLNLTYKYNQEDRKFRKTN